MPPHDDTLISNGPKKLPEQPEQGPTGVFQTPVHQDNLHQGNLVGMVLNGAYRIDARLAEGGMGVVYKATQLALGRTVAVKTILPSARGEETAVQRFLREAKLLSKLSHPNIVNLIDFGSVEPGPIYYMVMEHLQGESLEDFVFSRKRLSAEAILDMMGQICAGVAAAHQNQMVHRDLKPSNIFLVNISASPRPMAKILDFGLARLCASDKPIQAITRTGLIVGTLGFTAPEQLEGSEPDARADIYSLGAILYFMVTGDLPYKGESLQSVLTKQLTQKPEAMKHKELGLPQSHVIEAVIHRAMSQKPADRYQTANDLHASLAAAMGLQETRIGHFTPTHVGRTTGDTGAYVPPAKRRLWVLGGAAAVILLATLLFLFLKKPGPDPEMGPVAMGPGVTEKDIVVGMVAPFSGPTKELGRGMQVGIETCFRNVNDKGGIHGRKLRLVPTDDGYEPKRTKEQMALLLEKPVFAFLGNVGTPTAEVAVPMALEQKRVFFGPYTGASLLRRNPPDRYVFNFRASYAEETAAMVKYLVEMKHIAPGEIAVFAQKDAFGEDGFAGVVRALRKLNFDTKQILKVGFQRNTTDVAEAVQTLVKNKDRVKAVIMVAPYRPAAKFIQEMKDRDMDVIFSNVSFVGSDALAETLRDMGPKYMAGVIVTQVVPHFASSATAVIRYRELLKKYFPAEMPGFISLEGFLAANVFVEGLRNAGPALTPEALVDALEKIRDLDIGIGAPVTFGLSDHQASIKVWGTILDEEGVYRILELE